MGDMFRCEKMALCQMFIQPEAAYATIAELGEVGCVQFRDLNAGVNNFQRKFVGDVRRCDEMERQLNYIENELRKQDVKIIPMNKELPNAPNPREIVDLENELERIESELVELSHNAVNLRKNFVELNELRLVLEHTDAFFAEGETMNLDSVHRKAGGDRGALGSMAGIVRRERSYAFERMLWRISRGNIYLKRCDIDEPLKDPITGANVYKTAFVVFFQGDAVQARIKKICTGFHAALYPCPSVEGERADMIKGVRVRIDDLKTVLAQSDDHCARVFGHATKCLPKWIVMVKKAKAIYHTLNMFNINISENCLIGEAWVPRKDVEQVQQALLDGSTDAGCSIKSFINILHTEKRPPTFFRTNKFTRGFQNLIDAYGMATYREANPGLYTCITFPFLFAVMFGDLGHGFLLFLFALYMVVAEKSLAYKRGGEIWRIFFAGRYIILLMGLYAMYTGFIYNDIFSKSINVFGTHWRIRYNVSTVLTNPAGLQLDPKYFMDGVYPMGIDPIWQSASNKIIFLNTYKMKLSIITGVLHMVFGVCLSVENYVYFKRYASIFLEFVPQVIFLLLLFGYLCFMMFWKWVQYSPTATLEVNTPGCAPSVLILFINMMLFKSNTALPGCKPLMYNYETIIDEVFVVVAIICIPWMLLGKPLYIQFKRKRALKRKLADLEFYIEEKPSIEEITLPNTEPDAVASTSPEDEHEEEEPMSEIWIHQAIHTIEYILSTISHTASYLRLWALSLAHAELSEVLWTMVMAQGLQISGYGGAIALFFIFGIWELLTIAIMLMMEGLSAFLHTLRLHWVEFMSKFFEGAGYAFQPFSFKEILDDKDD